MHIFDGLGRGTERALEMVGVVVALLLLTSPALARQDGTDNPDCNGCHYGEANLRPALEIPSDPVLVEPGEEVTIPVMLSAKGANAFGVLLRSSEMLSTTQEGVEPDEAGLGHTKPLEAPDGSLSWTFSFRAPDEVGVSQIEVSAVAAIRDEEPENDSHVSGVIAVAHGCDPYVAYQDEDGDGFGADGSRQVSCEPLESSADKGGDCDDDDPNRNPDAEELCNLIDDNCDGVFDDGLEVGLLYPDDDLDGYGRVGDAEFGCVEEGKSLVTTDCDDTDGDVYPTATEICNGIDDDCNGEVDDDCVDEKDAKQKLEGGCAVTPAGLLTSTSTSLILFMLLLTVGWALRGAGRG